MLFDKLLNNCFVLPQCYNMRAVHASEDEDEIHRRSVNERPLRRRRSKNWKVNFAEANTWPFLVERSFQNLSNWLKLKSKSGFKIVEQNGRERLRQKWNSACAHPGTFTVRIIREFIIATNTVTLETACLITVVSQVSLQYFATLNCLTHQRMEIKQAFDSNKSKK